MSIDNKQSPITQGRLNASIEKGIDYLYQHQLANGEFCCYYAPDEEMKEWCVPDSTVFPTATISISLLGLKEHPKVSKILSAAASFLKYQMLRGAVWSYYTKWNPIYSYVPADTDDSVIIPYFLRAFGEDVPDNTDILLTNRNSSGLFYTWLVLRLKRMPKSHLICLGRELKRPLKSLMFWMKYETTRKDIDVVVNANVLFCKGLNEYTQPIVPFLNEIVSQKSIEENDNWYKSPFILFYSLSRNYKTVPELGKSRDAIIDEINSSAKPDGSYGLSKLDTALCICSLLNLGYHDSKLDLAIDYLIENQNSYGYWDRYFFYYSGNSKIVGWGSEEITTGFCLESLCAYQNYIKENNPTKKP